MIFLPSEGNKEYEIITKMEQEQWLQLKIMFLLSYNLKTVISCKCVCVCVCVSERERERERVGGKLTFGGWGTPPYPPSH